MSLRKRLTELEWQMRQLSDYSYSQRRAIWDRLQVLGADASSDNTTASTVLQRLARLERLHKPRCATCGAEQAMPEQHPAPAMTWTLAAGEEAARGTRVEAAKQPGGLPKPSIACGCCANIDGPEMLKHTIACMTCPATICVPANRLGAALREAGWVYVGDEWAWICPICVTIASRAHYKQHVQAGKQAAKERAKTEGTKNA